MIAPGMVFGAGDRVAATIGAGTVPDFFNQGVGFKTGGNLAFDTNAPASPGYDGGVAQSAAGAFHSTTVQSGTDVFISGLRVSALGQLVIESANAVTYVNGNPVTAAGNFAVN